MGKKRIHPNNNPQNNQQNDNKKTRGSNVIYPLSSSSNNNQSTCSRSSSSCPRSPSKKYPAHDLDVPYPRIKPLHLSSNLAHQNDIQNRKRSSNSNSNSNSNGNSNNNKVSTAGKDNTVPHLEGCLNLLDRLMECNYRVVALSHTIRGAPSVSASASGTSSDGKKKKKISSPDNADISLPLPESYFERVIDNNEDCWYYYGRDGLTNDKNDDNDDSYNSNTINSNNNSEDDDDNDNNNESSDTKGEQMKHTKKKKQQRRKSGVGHRNRIQILKRLNVILEHSSDLSSYIDTPSSSTTTDSSSNKGLFDSTNNEIKPIQEIILSYNILSALPYNDTVIQAICATPNLPFSIVTLDYAPSQSSVGLPFKINAKLLTKLMTVRGMVWKDMDARVGIPNSATNTNTRRTITALEIAYAPSITDSKKRYAFITTGRLLLSSLATIKKGSGGFINSGKNKNGNNSDDDNTRNKYSEQHLKIIISSGRREGLGGGTTISHNKKSGMEMEESGLMALRYPGDVSNLVQVLLFDNGPSSGSSSSTQTNKGGEVLCHNPALVVARCNVERTALSSTAHFAARGNIVSTATLSLVASKQKSVNTKNNGLEESLKRSVTLSRQKLKEEEEDESDDDEEEEEEDDDDDDGGEIKDSSSRQNLKEEDYKNDDKEEEDDHGGEEKDECRAAFLQKLKDEEYSSEDREKDEFGDGYLGF